MRTKISSLFSRLRRDEEGVTLVEYGIALVLAVGVGTAALSTLAGAVDAKMNSAELCLESTTTTGPCGVTS